MGRINYTWLKRRKDKTPTVQTVVDLPADALLKSVNDTAGNARNLFVTYILLSVYIFLTVGATNDEQLFRDSGVAVPFLNNINLPVSRFYQFVPWMFLFIHVDLLLLFKLMADKLHAFNAELADMAPPEAEEYRQQLNGLPFVHWLAGDQTDGFSHFITGVVVWTSLFLLPLLTLLALQIGFLPYHSAFTTRAHQAILLLDALALLWFWPRLAAEKGRQTWRWWLPVGMKLIELTATHDNAVELVPPPHGGRLGGGRSNSSESSDLTRPHPNPPPLGEGVLEPNATALGSEPAPAARPIDRPYSTIPFATVFRMWREKAKASVSFLLRRAQQRLTQRTTPATAPKPTVCRGLCRTASVVMLLSSVWFGWFVAVLPGERLEDDGLLVHWLMDNADTAKPDEEEVQKVTNLPWYYSVQPQLPLLHRNLDLHEKLLVANDPDLETLAKLQEPELKQQERLILLVKIKGLDLQNRDLRFANLAEAKLWKADLRGANMQQANLSETQLQGIQWGEKAQLQGAILRKAKLQGAEFRQAKLQGAELSQANLKLKVPDLEQVAVKVADRVGADLQGADLWRADLQGAHLDYAKLQGAKLPEAYLQGAELSGADLQRAQLLRADLRGAKLSGAYFQGAYLWGADLEGAELLRADLRGAILSGTYLQGAYLWGADLHNANLGEAWLQGANFENVQVGSTVFSQASFAFNDFRYLQTLPVFTQQDVESLKAGIRDLKDENANKQRDHLQSRVGKATEWPKEAIAAPCLADQPSAPPFQNCLAPNPGYYQALANYLGDLACRANEDFKGQDFIALGIARRTIDSTEWGIEGESARRQLVQRLLKPDCVGQAGLTDDQRAVLRKLAAAP